MRRSRSSPTLPIEVSPVILTPETVLRVLGTLGLTNEEMAEVFGISLHVFQDLLAANPTWDDILRTAKTEPNRRVEASLYRRALGYQAREVVKVSGKPVRVTIKDIAPDVIAAIFWLKNREPKRWRDTLDVTHTLRDRFDRAHRALSYSPDGSGDNGEDKIEKEGELVK